jgi:hypothetical protein
MLLWAGGCHTQSAELYSSVIQARWGISIAHKPDLGNWVAIADRARELKAPSWQAGSLPANYCTGLPLSGFRFHCQCQKPEQGTLKKLRSWRVHRAYQLDTFFPDVGVCFFHVVVCAAVVFRFAPWLGYWAPELDDITSQV